METNLSQHAALIERDRRAVWHPFTQEKWEPSPIPITHAKGSMLYAANGKSYIDGISSWWANLHGHCHPYIVEKIAQQARRLEHVMFGGFTHETAISLAEKLLGLLPHPFSRVFFSDNGSTAVETALKMVFQYWVNHGNHQKTRLLSLEGAYHGDTFGAMSATGRTGFNKPFWPWLFDVVTIPPPFAGQEEESLAVLEGHLREHETIAGFIFEPIIQGAGGMRIYSADALARMIERCRKSGVITIADEIMTGFGRTGPSFAEEHAGVFADIICVSKGLTGGFLPLAATMCSEMIYEAFLHDAKEKAFLHGHTYTANPLACSAALASLELFEQEGCTIARQKIESAHSIMRLRWLHHEKVKRCEVLGTILIVEYACSQEPGYFNELSKELRHHFMDNGVLLRPLGNVLYVMPPYCITEDELGRIYELIDNSLGNIK